MDENVVEEEFGQWFSTYGVITAERILGHYQISVAQKDLLSAIKNPVSFYHKLVLVPLKHVLNGIILQQANDYHVYTQKLFIDYLLSGESGKPPESQGAFTRDSLEEERKELVKLGEEFNQQQLDQDTLIAYSQMSLIKLTREWREHFESGLSSVHETLNGSGFDVKKSAIREGITSGLIYCDITDPSDPHMSSLFVDKIAEKLKISINEDIKELLIFCLSDLFAVVASFNEVIQEFIDKVNDMGAQARAFRTRFYETVLRVLDLIKLLPEYKIDPAQDAINREPLYFDKTIGER